jgi:hypothetical protein
MAVGSAKEAPQMGEGRVDKFHSNRALLHVLTAQEASGLLAGGRLQVEAGRFQRRETLTMKVAGFASREVVIDWMAADPARHVRRVHPIGGLANAGGGAGSALARALNLPSAQAHISADVR